MCVIAGSRCKVVDYQSHTSTLLSTQSLSCTVLCRVGGSLGLVRGMAHSDGGVDESW
jgi:hypothetical protein